MKTGVASPPTIANFSHFKLVVLMSWMVAVVGHEVRDERIFHCTPGDPDFRKETA